MSPILLSTMAAHSRKIFIMKNTILRSSHLWSINFLRTLRWSSLIWINPSKAPSLISSISLTPHFSIMDRENVALLLALTQTRNVKSVSNSRQSFSIIEKKFTLKIKHFWVDLKSISWTKRLCWRKNSKHNSNKFWNGLKS